MSQVLLLQGEKNRLKRVHPLTGYFVRVTWSDDVTEIKDLGPLLLNHRAFSKVRSDSDLFDTVQVGDQGRRLVWDDGASLNISAIEKLPRTSMDASEFKSIMADLHLNSDALGRLLGLSRRAITGYRGGVPIPNAVVLAMRYVAQRWDA
ncbi:hypothetical protein DEVEQU_03185 [Devosia equisanguinis]|uniref:DUF2442 domain-containing protein n=2 Tax=Devosia equisanguinis TaxID=2490941 RepID=A0A447IEV4_9HYPH|nr:hypothetical protein DEVEQU_03185 [Devosia equisanguinis]